MEALHDPIIDNLALVRGRIADAARAAGRPAESVRLMAVSKTRPPEAVIAAWRAGQRLFGENRVQEAQDKIAAVAALLAKDPLGGGPAVADPPEWHLIGHLQTNKARAVPGVFQGVQSVDSERVARALERQCALSDATLQVCLQLNLDAEQSKSGVGAYPALLELAQAVLECPHLVLSGLMTIPDPSLDESGTRTVFARVRTLHEQLRGELDLGPTFCELSMGMSHDYVWAIAEGATVVRVGTAIFGARS